MGDVVNLRRVRKAKVRALSAQAAMESRVRHGRTKGEREAEVRTIARAEERLDGHRLGEGE